jgi:hypothetical protein
LWHRWFNPWRFVGRFQEKKERYVSVFSRSSRLNLRIDDLKHTLRYAAFLAMHCALRMDLGVYAVEFAEIERGFKRYDRKTQGAPKAGVIDLPANSAAQTDGSAAA